MSSVTANQPWLSVVNVDMSSDGLGRYRLTINRTGLSDGIYNATVVVSSDAGSDDIPVRMQVAGTNESADAGLHYVILVDATGNNVGETEVVSASNGVYVYTFTNIPYGQYEIFAGTDLDDDFFLCDAGEACGTYPNLDSPEFVSVNGDLSGLDFLSGFRLNLTEFTSLNPTGTPDESKKPSISVKKQSTENTDQPSRNE